MGTTEDLEFRLPPSTDKCQCADQAIRPTLLYHFENRQQEIWDFLSVLPKDRAKFLPILGLKSELFD